MQGCTPPPIEPVSQWAIPENTKQGGEVVEDKLLKTPWELLGFSFTPGNSKQNKASPVEIPQNCVTSHRNFKA